MGSASKKEKKVKKESKRKRTHDDAEATLETDVTKDDEKAQDVAVEAAASNKKTEKKEKKQKKKKDTRSIDVADGGDDSAANDDDDAHKEIIPDDKPAEHQYTSKSSKATSKHALKRLERQKLMEQVPKVDEHGIAYTKLQLRRMRKRVERGLHPIETPHEEQERLQREAQLKREEEMELAGMMVIGTKDGDDEEEVEGDEDGQDEGDEEASDNEKDHEGQDEPIEQEVKPRPKKKARTKPLPPDYTCMACNNKHSPAHWIYDCPSKVRLPGSNQVAKHLKGIHNPDAKVFVSGLPFDVKQKDVIKLFEECGKVAHCKLVQFEDTKRCKGNAYVTFESKDDTLKALKLNGKKQTLKDGKELSLKVTKALSRALTKKGSPAPAKANSKFTVKKDE
ncbi:hypothetical protein MPSEU_000353900 [Mayamaea pseudoterrestris]|nr:hypothetical protein MPSEU_000353900 [Mayamaea pseudoterrestris]